MGVLVELHLSFHKIFKEKGKGIDMTVKERIIKELKEWVPYILIALALSFVITRYIGQRTRVEGSSMETTLHDKDQLIADKISYRFTDPERFEVIVFPYAQDEDVHYIKRIIGLPGETIQIKDGYIYINEKRLEEDYGSAKIITPGTAAMPIELGEDEYFVMGDNRNNSKDSRFESVGLIQRDKIIGRAWVRIYPFNQMGAVLHD